MVKSGVVNGTDGVLPTGGMAKTGASIRAGGMGKTEGISTGGMAMT
jgi:hypothetical protein